MTTQKNIIIVCIPSCHFGRNILQVDLIDKITSESI